MDKINSYKDLIAWQRAHSVAMKVLVLSKKVKRYDLTYEIWRQLIRSVFSVPANICEGHSGHWGKNFASYLEVSRGSASESQYWLLVLMEAGEILKQDYELLNVELEEIKRMISSISKKIKAKKLNP